MLNKIVDLDPEKRGRLLDRACWWFTDCLTIVEPNSNFGGLLSLLKSDEDFCEFAEKFLETVGTGIGSLSVETAELESDRLPSEIIGTLQNANASENASFPLGAGSDLSLGAENPAKIIRRNLIAGHKIGESATQMLTSFFISFVLIIIILVTHTTVGQKQW